MGRECKSLKKTLPDLKQQALGWLSLKIWDPVSTDVVVSGGLSSPRILYLRSLGFVGRLGGWCSFKIWEAVSTDMAVSSGLASYWILHFMLLGFVDRFGDWTLKNRALLQDKFSGFVISRSMVIFQEVSVYHLCFSFYMTI